MEVHFAQTTLLEISFESVAGTAVLCVRLVKGPECAASWRKCFTRFLLGSKLKQDGRQQLQSATGLLSPVPIHKSCLNIY